MSTVRRIGGRASSVRHVGVAAGSETPTRIAAEIDECVYAVWTPDRLIKIGYTTDLGRRIRGFGSKWQDVLLVIYGDLAYEQALHDRFKAYLARGSEYYFPVIEIREWINSERSLLGIGPSGLRQTDRLCQSAGRFLHVRGR